MGCFKYFIWYQANKSAHWERHQTNKYAKHPILHAKRHGLERRTTKLNNQNLAEDRDQKNPNKELVFGDPFEYIELVVNAPAAIVYLD